MNDVKLIILSWKNSKTEIDRNRWYSIYLKTEHWKMKRHRALVRSMFTCDNCRKSLAVEVRHLSVQRLGAERRSDLVALCEECNSLSLDNLTVTTEQHRDRLNEEKRQRSLDRWSKKIGIDVT